jgi:hypothetical protein
MCVSELVLSDLGDMADIQWEFPDLLHLISEPEWTLDSYHLFSAYDDPGILFRLSHFILTSTLKWELFLSLFILKTE